MTRVLLVLLVLAATTAAAAPPATESSTIASALTTKLFREIASKKRPLAQILDPRSGVIDIEYTEASPDNASTDVIRAERWCGAELDAQHDAIRRAFRFPQQMEGLGELKCTTRGAPKCVFGGFEHRPDEEYHFARRGRGFVLIGLATVSRAALGKAWRAKADAYVAKQLAVAARQPCQVP